MRAGGDDDRVRPRVEHQLRRRLDAHPHVDTELAYLAGEEPRDAGVFGAGRRARGEQHLSAELGRLLHEDNVAATQRGDARRFQPGHAATDDDDALGRRRPP